MKLTYKHVLDSPETILQICDWYFEEWKIDKKTTETKLSHCGLDIPLQIIVFADDLAVATGGLDNEVNLHRVEPRFKQYSPWLALLYTVPEMRGKGVGSYLCDCLELEAKKLNIRESFLSTSTAQSFYLKKGWQEIEQIVLENKKIFVMRQDTAKLLGAVVTLRWR